MDRSELISVLGVSELATTGEVRRARRSVARFLHPDANTEDARTMADVNAACDDWLADIRARVDRPPTSPNFAETRTTGLPNLDARYARCDRRSRLSSTLVVGLVIVVVVCGIVLRVAGASVPTFAAGLLIGVGVGGFFAVVSLLDGERRRNH